MDQVIIFDTTLRDGEQSPGASMTKAEKLRIALLLDSMGVNVIEAGFAAASDGDFEAILNIAERLENAVVCSLSRAKKYDIERAAGSIKPQLGKQGRGRIHTFISTSPLHREHKLRMDKAQVLEAIKESVGLARNYTDDVEWSCEDGTRTELDFLYQSVDAAIKAGATTINIPDTVGYALPWEYGNIFKLVQENVVNSDKVVFSTHGQNDLGLATANSLEAVKNGARQIECTINGLGERAGNTALEEVVMAIDTRRELVNLQHSIDTTKIMKASKLVSAITGFNVQPNKAIVGANAFAHESGIHQDGMLKHAGTYEIMTPESVGLTKSSLTMGKLSGRHALKARLEEMGYDLSTEELDETFKKFKSLADRKKQIFDEDIAALVDATIGSAEDTIRLEALTIECGTGGRAKATLSLEIDGKIEQTMCRGDGPVDATFQAIRALYPHEAHLQLYQVNAVTQGIDAQAEVTVRLENNGHIGHGQGAHTDVVVASGEAYLQALNGLMRKL